MMCINDKYNPVSFRIKINAHSILLLSHVDLSKYHRSATVLKFIVTSKCCHPKLLIKAESYKD